MTGFILWGLLAVAMLVVVRMAFASEDEDWDPKDDFPRWDD